VSSGVTTANTRTLDIARAATGITPSARAWPGLWEITLTVRTNGEPPMPSEVLAKLTPEERG